MLYAMLSLAPSEDAGAVTREDALALLRRVLSVFSAALPDDARPLLEARLHELLEQCSTADLQRAVTQLRESHAPWGYHAATGLGRAINHVMCDISLARDSVVEGRERLASVRGRPVVMLCNHLSYSDAHVVQGLLQRAGVESVSEHLTVIAGPKVFEDPVRRVAGSSFAMIKTPQSHAIVAGHAADGESVAPCALSAREIALHARHSIECAAERMALGDTLLIFPEGTRSRSFAMQPGLPAVARYFDVDGCAIVPLALMGSQHVMALGDDRLRSARVVLRVGAPIDAAELSAVCGGIRKCMVDAVCLRIADLLDPEYRGSYGLPMAI